MKFLPRIILYVAVTVLVAAGGYFILQRLKYPYYFAYAGDTALSLSQMRSQQGRPSAEAEKRAGMCLEAERGNWEKVLELTAQDRRTLLGTYFHNLACAMQGHLADSLMRYYQPFSQGLFLPVKEGTSPFLIAQSGEVWYRLGAMTMAERSAMLAMTFSPVKAGPRFLRRLADINLINGDDYATLKYARLLGSYPEWTSEKERIKDFTAKYDTVHFSADCRSVLKILLQSNKDNSAAYEYLLCYDLLEKNIPFFIEDYDSSRPSSRLYEEAALIYLSGSGDMTLDNIIRFRISERTFREFEDFTSIYETGGDHRDRRLDKYRYTYWYYFKFAKLVTNEKK